MEYKINETVLFEEDGRTVKGDIVDIRGDYYVVSRGLRETLVSNDRIIGVVPKSKFLGIFENGGSVDGESNPDADFINSIEFYRYYPMGLNPFKISYEPKNKYGFGIYFLDNPDFYKDKFEDSRLVKIKPKVKAPLILTYHKRTTPSFEYASMLLDLIQKGEVKDRDDLSRKLINSGFDSLVVYEPRGIYLIILKEDESLFDVIYDKGATEKLTDESNQKEPNEFSYEIGELVNTEYTDINGHQGELLFRNFFDDKEGFFIPANADIEYVEDLCQKGYLKRDLEVVGNAYVLDEKGIDFIEDINAST